MSNVTHVLSQEHQNILKVIEVILKECELMEAESLEDTNFFRKAIAFIKNYADKFHHAKEEDILFNAIVDNLGDMPCNPVSQMLHEHEIGRECVQGMEEAIEEEDMDKLTENARKYCFLLKDHIYKEDNILFPMAEDLIDDNRKEKIRQKYQQVDSGELAQKALQYLESIVNPDKS